MTGYCPEHTPKEERLGYIDDQYVESYKSIAKVRKAEKVKKAEELKKENEREDNGLAGKDSKKK